MESTCKKNKFRHKNSDCNTFSKTFISIGQAIKTTNEMSNKEDFVGRQGKVIGEQTKCEGIQNDIQTDEKHSKVISKELPSSEVSVSLLISRNHNASISASCYFNSKQQQQQSLLPPPIRKFNNNNERNSFPFNKTSKLKIVEIPFEERQLINTKGRGGIKKREEEWSSSSPLPTSPPIFSSWQNFKNSNKSDSTGIGSSLSVSSNNSSSGESDHHHFFIQNNPKKDYRVISLDEKPSPGKLDDFVPEVERGKIQKEKNNKTTKESKNKEIKYFNFPSLNRPNSTIYEGLENKKWNDFEARKIFEKNNGCEIKKETNSLERDEYGRLIISSNEWRRFLAEQRPSNTNKINSQLQIVFRKDNYI